MESEPCRSQAGLIDIVMQTTYVVDTRGLSITGLLLLLIDLAVLYLHIITTNLVNNVQSVGWTFQKRQPNRELESRAYKPRACVRRLAAEKCLMELGRRIVLGQADAAR